MNNDKINEIRRRLNVLESNLKNSLLDISDIKNTLDRMVNGDEIVEPRKTRTFFDRPFDKTADSVTQDQNYNPFSGEFEKTEKIKKPEKVEKQPKKGPSIEEIMKKIDMKIAQINKEDVDNITKNSAKPIDKRVSAKPFDMEARAKEVIKEFDKKEEAKKDEEERLAREQVKKEIREEFDKKMEAKKEKIREELKFQEMIDNIDKKTEELDTEELGRNHLEEVRNIFSLINTRINKLKNDYESDKNKLFLSLAIGTTPEIKEKNKNLLVEEIKKQVDALEKKENFLFGYVARLSTLEIDEEEKKDIVKSKIDKLVDDVRVLLRDDFVDGKRDDYFHVGNFYTHCEELKNELQVNPLKQFTFDSNLVDLLSIRYCIELFNVEKDYVKANTVEMKRANAVLLNTEDATDEVLLQAINNLENAIDID